VSSLSDVVPTQIDTASIVYSQNESRRLLRVLLIICGIFTIAYGVYLIIEMFQLISLADHFYGNPIYYSQYAIIGLILILIGSLFLSTGNNRDWIPLHLLIKKINFAF